MAHEWCAPKTCLRRSSRAHRIARSPQYWHAGVHNWSAVVRGWSGGRISRGDHYQGRLGTDDNNRHPQTEGSLHLLPAGSPQDVSWGPVLTRRSAGCDSLTTHATGVCRLLALAHGSGARRTTRSSTLCGKCVSALLPSLGRPASTLRLNAPDFLHVLQSNSSRPPFLSSTVAGCLSQAGAWLLSGTLTNLLCAILADDEWKRGFAASVRPQQAGLVEGP